jgi:hypothetical protein
MARNYVGQALNGVVASRRKIGAETKTKTGHWRGEMDELRKVEWGHVNSIPLETHHK